MSGLLFIRHAETDMAGRFCGHSDPPVNARGHLQIEELLRTLRNEEIGSVYTSDLERALCTARALAEAFGVPCVARPGLREIHFGAWEGLAWRQIEERDEDYARRWIESFPSLPAPEGESFPAFEARVLAEVAAISRAAGSLTTAVVTHGGPMRVVLQRMCGLSEREAWAMTKPYGCFFRYPLSSHDPEMASAVPEASLPPVR